MWFLIIVRVWKLCEKSMPGRDRELFRNKEYMNENSILLFYCLFTLSIFSPARVVTAMIINLCNTNSNRVWNQLTCIKLNWEYMSTSVTYSRLKNLKIFPSLFIKIRKLLLKISTDIPTNISFLAVWNKFPVKNINKYLYFDQNFI